MTGNMKEDRNIMVLDDNRQNAMERTGPNSA
jgi:hypothetical protein